MRLQKSLPFFAALLMASSLAAGNKTLTVSVRGQVAPDYQREKLADGTFKHERYVIANGGKFPGTTTDVSMDKISYPEVAGVVAKHLVKQQYYLAKRAKDADLLIAIYWGETVPFSDNRYNEAMDTLGKTLANNQTISMGERISQETGEISMASVTGGDAVLTGSMEFGLARVEMENRLRDEANADNAKILGYMDDINDRRDMVPWTDITNKERDLVADVEESRYYVVVRAYDFKALQKEGRQVVRWTTRISIGSQGNGFDERVAQMVAAAADTFGQKQGLRRRFYGDPRVDLGETQFLGQASVPETKRTGKD